MTTKFKFLFASLVIAGITTVSAQTVGYVTKTIAAGSLATPTSAAFSLTLSRTPASGFVGSTSGALTAVGTNTLTDTAAGWATNFPTTAQPYFVRITSGNGEGRIFQVTSNTGTVLTVSNGGFTLSSQISAGDTYQLLLGETLATMFNGIGVLGGTTAADADNVMLYTGSSWVTYYFNSTANQWRSGTLSIDRSNVVISPNAGLIYSRRGNTSLSIVNSGLVSEAKFETEIAASATTFLSGIYPVDTTLNALNIQNIPGWVSVTANNGTTADKVIIFTGTSWATYYYRSDVSQWRSGTLNIDRNTVAIAAGTPVLVQRISGSGTATLARNKPY